MQTKSKIPDGCILTLARPADVLSAQVSSIATQNQCECLPCSSVYDVLVRLQQVTRGRQTILIARPAMLTKTHLASTLQHYPDLHLIGWLSPEEAFTDTAFGTISSQGMVMVSNTEQLRRVIAAFRNAWIRNQVHHDLEDPKLTARKISDDEYTLSNDELDALLGAG